MSKQQIIEQLNDAIRRIAADPDAPLVEFARDLRELPSIDFKLRLRAELEKQMSMSAKLVKLRPGFRTVTPYLLPPNAELVDFLKNVFGAEETFHGATSPTSFHAEFRIGDSMLMLGVGSNRSMPASLFIYVPDVDETYRKALAAGAKPLFEILENYGDRFGAVQDPAGNAWVIATYLGRQPVVAQDQLNTITTAFKVRGSAQFIEYLKNAFNATEVVRYDYPDGGVIHAKIRLGESIVAVGEAKTEQDATRTMVYFYVPDCDATYEQALHTGAKSISPLADQPYGDRHGGVEDGWGNQWFIATPL